MRHLKWNVCEPKMCMQSVQDCRSGHELQSTVHEENNKRETYNYEAWYIGTQSQPYRTVFGVSLDSSESTQPLGKKISLDHFAHGVIIKYCNLSVRHLYIYVRTHYMKKSTKVSSPNPLGCVLCSTNFTFLNQIPFTFDSRIMIPRLQITYVWIGLDKGVC